MTSFKHLRRKDSGKEGKKSHKNTIKYGKLCRIRLQILKIFQRYQVKQPTKSFHTIEGATRLRPARNGERRRSVLRQASGKEPSRGRRSRFYRGAAILCKLDGRFFSRLDFTSNIIKTFREVEQSCSIV